MAAATDGGRAGGGTGRGRAARPARLEPAAARRVAGRSPDGTGAGARPVARRRGTDRARCGAGDRLLGALNQVARSAPACAGGSSAAAPSRGDSAAARSRGCRTPPWSARRTRASDLRARSAAASSCSRSRSPSRGNLRIGDARRIDVDDQQVARTTRASSRHDEPQVVARIRPRARPARTPRRRPRAATASTMSSSRSRPTSPSTVDTSSAAMVLPANAIT